MSDFPSSADRALARRIEAADAAIIHNLIPSAPAFAAEPAAGGWSIFAGAGSPLTHVVGAGMSGPVSEEELDRVEAFYCSRGAACVIDLCPLADEQLIRRIQARPYRPVEFNNVMVRRAGTGDLPLPTSVRHIGPDDYGEWMRVVAAGFADADEPPAGALDGFAGIVPPQACFVAELDGRAAAGGGMGMHEGVAWMSGDATLPRARGRGLQADLIRARLSWARARGCDLACAAVLPGTASHRNYERAGFRLMYMRVNVMREFGGEVRP
jgi:GNAT superfamily N-acetyltransferase